jgi:CheY-like chemotaxis protein
MARHVRKGLVLLVVDDDEDVREVAVHYLETIGFSVCQARNGREALQYLAERPDIGVMFTDIKMPLMDGNQLVDEAMRMRPGLKIVMTTGFASRVKSRHSVPLVRKPYRLGDLARTFEKVLSEKK